MSHVKLCDTKSLLSTLILSQRTEWKFGGLEHSGRPSTGSGVACIRLPDDESSARNNQEISGFSQPRHFHYLSVALLSIACASFISYLLRRDKILSNMSTVADTPHVGDTEPVVLSIVHHGKALDLSFAQDASIADLSSQVEEQLRIPATNQKFMIAKLGLLKPPFKDPTLPLSELTNKKITLMGSTTHEVNVLNHTAAQAAAISARPKAKVSTAKAYATRDWKKEAEEAQYTFTTLRPLPYLPNPSKSLAFLQRLKDDVGIKSAMRKHKFTVPLLTEMNPVEHTQSNHEGTSRTLGLNRNRGEVIELRLRTDAYDGYRDYKTIRNTLCHELAHNVHGPHDRNFWELCKQIEREVEGADYHKSGRSLNDGDSYYGADEEDIDDHGGWTGGDFVLGTSAVGSSQSADAPLGAGISRREVLAKAAEERMRRQRESGSDNSSSK